MLEGLKITVLGLGLHGSGVAAAQYCAQRGAQVTVTDLKDETRLQKSLAQLEGLPIRYVLGRHDRKDIETADIVVKNPSVPAESAILKGARRIETDLSLFFRARSPLILAITGSKGKSTTASAIHHVLTALRSEVKIGGNIGTSPLEYLNEGVSVSEIVLELSSFQIEDLHHVATQEPPAHLPEVFRGPLYTNLAVAILTNLYPDHLNMYPSFEAYVAAKEHLFERPHARGIYNFDDERCRAIAQRRSEDAQFFSAHPQRDKRVIAWIEEGRVRLRDTILPARGFLSEKAPRLSLLTASAAAAGLDAYGLSAEEIARQLPDFAGIRHRMEHLGEWRKIAFYNDTASTIPQSTYASLQGFARPVVLIIGGANKNLDFSPLRDIAAAVKKIVVLAGSAGDIVADMLRAYGQHFHGPCGRLEDAFDAACDIAEAGDAVVFSPAATSFEMYENEFERGDHFCRLVCELISS